MKALASFAPTKLFALLLSVAMAGAAAAADGEWENFPDGSTGRTTKFHGGDGTAIPAYVRKPAGPGPFPVVVMLHGGATGAEVTYAMGRSTPPSGDFIKAGWVVYAIDYRTTKQKFEHPEVEDSIEAIKGLAKNPFIDSVRVGLMGGSRGGQITCRVMARIKTRGAIVCAPAGVDLIEIKKAAGRGEKFVNVLKKMVADMEEHLGAKAEEIEKDPAKYGYSSALTEAAQVRCPVLIVNGQNDTSAPLSVIEVYIKKLRAEGKQVDTYLPENGPHGFYFGHPDLPESKEVARRAVAFFQERFATAAGQKGEK